MASKYTGQEKVSLKASQLPAFFKKVSIAKRTRRKKFRPYVMPEEIHLNPDEGLSLMEKAQRILGQRMTEKRGFGYYLDGRPASAERIAQEAGFSLRT